MQISNLNAMEKTYKVEIKPKTIILTLIILALCWLFFKLYNVLILTFIAFAISSTLSPTIEYLYSKKIPKNLSVFIIYLLFLTSIILFVIIIYKPLISQIESFVKALPNIFDNALNLILTHVPFIREKYNIASILEKIKDSFWSNFTFENISSYFFSGIGKAFGVFESVIGFTINFLYIIVVSIYFIQLKEDSKQKIFKLIPNKYHGKITSFLNTIEKQLGSWIRAQGILMLYIATMTIIGLEIIGSNFSFPIGIISGILSFIPGLGPFIALILAIIVTIGSNMVLWKTIFISIWFLFIHQLEQYIVYPKVMQKVVGLNPLILIITLYAVSLLLNFWGAILAVPIVLIIQLSLRYYIDYTKNQKV